MKPVTLAVTCGDPEGIGPEVAAKALGALLPRDDVEFLLLGPHSLWGEALTRWAPRVRLLADRSPGDPGHPPDGVTLLVPEGRGPERGGTSGGRIAMRALDAGIVLAQAGIARGIVTAPLAKDRLPERDDAPGRWHGQTEILASRCNADPLMAFWTGSLLVGVATDHIPLRDVPRSVTAARVEGCLRLLAAAL
ncbi:MAG: 4-hydroxythreonine-4-phosphate dehydrogenase PdxA, partial [Planctomycetes bacterium]|nr:4-hydroxythreonine-4-phosphate dehydrogenase PdxA [Planctomycetota bacterium]